MNELNRRYGSLFAKSEYLFRKWHYDFWDKHGTIAITHCGKLGDFIAGLPVASWLNKTRGKKIHFVLARSFEPFTKISSLLELQDMTAKVSLADFPVKDWEKGGRPYRFNPNDFGIPVKEYYNFGFRRTPRTFVPEYIAQEHGLGYDADFTLKLDPIHYTDDVLCSDGYMLAEVPTASAVDHSKDLLENARRLAGARESHVSQSGMFHILDWAGTKPTKVYIYPHSVNLPLFTRNFDLLNIVHVSRAVR